MSRCTVSLVSVIQLLSASSAALLTFRPSLLPVFPWPAPAFNFQRPTCDFRQKIAESGVPLLVARSKWSLVHLNFERSVPGDPVHKSNVTTVTRENEKRIFIFVARESVIHLRVRMLWALVEVCEFCADWILEKSLRIPLLKVREKWTIFASSFLANCEICKLIPLYWG